MAHGTDTTEVDLIPQVFTIGETICFARTRTLTTETPCFKKGDGPFYGKYIVYTWAASGCGSTPGGSRRDTLCRAVSVSGLTEPTKAGLRPAAITWLRLQNALVGAHKAPGPLSMPGHV